MRCVVFAAGFATTAAVASAAELVSVSREHDSLYRVSGSEAYILTESCSETGSSEEAAIHNGELIFLDSKRGCRIAETLTKANLRAGNYNVTVSRKDANVYKMSYPTAYIITRYCYEYAYSEDAVLKWRSYSGELVWENGDDCDVEAVFTG